MGYRRNDPRVAPAAADYDTRLAAQRYCNYLRKKHPERFALEEAEAIAKGWASLYDSDVAQRLDYKSFKEQKEREEEAAQEAYLQRKHGWSILRNAKAFQRRLDEAGVKYQTEGPSGWGSLYYHISHPSGDRLTIRFANHPTPAGGAYKGMAFAGDMPLYEERHHEPDFSSDPYTGNTWREALLFLAEWMKD